MIEWSTVLQAGIGLLALYGAIRLITDRNDDQKCAAIMWVLQHADERGMYARDICKLTGISDSSIYIYLSRLEDRKWVRWTRDEQWPHRYRYHFVEEAARAAIKEHGIEP